MRYGDIAMLFRARGSLRIYEKALRKAGIPFYTLDGRGFYTTQEVKDILNFLRVVHDRHNDVALAGALRSPLFGASDDDLVRLRLPLGGGPGQGPGRGLGQGPGWGHSGGLHEGLMGAGRLMADRDAPAARFTNPDGLKKARETLLKYRRARRRLGPTAIIEGLLADTQFIEVLLTRFNGEQAAANVLKLVNIARGFERSGFHDLGGFLAHIDTLLEQEADEGQAQLESEAADAVKLLTIHKSKGLEFPVVVLPDLARSLNGGNREAVDFAFEKEIGMGIALRDPDGSRKTPDLEDIEARTRARGFYEDQRLLYVAMTRARDYLLFSGVLTGKNPKFDGQLHELDSWLKWICSVLGVDPAGLPDGSGELKFAGETLRVRNILGPDLPSTGTDVWKVEAEAAATVAATASPAATGAPLGEDGLERLIKQLEPLRDPAEIQLAFCPVTALMTFEQCPRRFYYQDVLGIPERPVLGLVRTWKAKAGSKRPAVAHGLEPGLNPRLDPRLDPIAKGNITHRVLARLSYPQPADPGEANPPDADPRDPGKWDGLLRSAILAEGITGEEQIQAVSNEIRPLIQNYLAGEVFKATGSAREVKSEIPFTYRCGRVILNGVIDKILVFAGEQVLTGQIGDRVGDRIKGPAIRPATDRALVVDFKTNQIRPEEMPELLQKYDLQLQTYALVARELFGYGRVEAGIYFPHLDSYQPVVVADSGAIRRRVEQIGAQISRGSSLADYPRKREGCAECSYRRFCGKS